MVFAILGRRRKGGVGLALWKHASTVILFLSFMFIENIYKRYTKIKKERDTSHREYSASRVGSLYTRINHDAKGCACARWFILCTPRTHQVLFLTPKWDIHKDGTLQRLCAPPHPCTYFMFAVNPSLTVRTRCGKARLVATLIPSSTHLLLCFPIPRHCNFVWNSNIPAPLH